MKDATSPFRQCPQTTLGRLDRAEPFEREGRRRFWDSFLLFSEIVKGVFIDYIRTCVGASSGRVEGTASRVEEEKTT
jgi:hypothetical protein